MCVLVCAHACECARERLCAGRVCLHEADALSPQGLCPRRPQTGTLTLALRSPLKGHFLGHAPFLDSRVALARKRHTPVWDLLVTASLRLRPPRVAPGCQPRLTEGPTLGSQTSPDGPTFVANNCGLSLFARDCLSEE